MPHIQRIIDNYYDFFDNKVGDSSLVVALVWVLILIVWLIVPTNSNAYKSSIYGSQNIPTVKESSIIEIWGKKYKIILEELS